MGLQNYLWIPDETGKEWLAVFRWGCVREIQYRVGDKLSWNHRLRPALADGLVRVGAYMNDGEFYRIEIENDLVRNYHKVAEAEYDELVSSLAEYDGQL